MATKTATTSKSHSASSPPAPVLKVTRYDTVSTTMIVIVIGLAVAVFMLILVWMSHHRFAVPPSTEYKVLFTENPGGFLDGTEGETLGGPDGPPAQFSDVESSPETEMDPNHQETETVEMDIMETIDSVNAVATSAPPQLQQMLPRHAVNIGERNEGMNFKQKGTGRKGLGNGPGVGGFGREQRWFVRFDEGGSLDEYARQLDFFEIELGVILADEKVLIYLTNLAAAVPTQRRVTATEDELRLYLVWQTAARRRVDEQLFKKAGIDASRGVCMHFYPPQTEQKLVEAEVAYRGLDPKEIAKTFFKVRPNGSGGYEFHVTDQKTIR